MLYSVEDNVHPPHEDNQQYRHKPDINNDLKEEENEDILYSQNYTNEEKVSNKGKLEDTLARENEKSINLERLKGMGMASPPSKIATSGGKQNSQTTSKKSHRSKLTTVSKGKRSRASRRAGSMVTYNTSRSRTGKISIAMKVLNMDEDEKEDTFFSTSQQNIKMRDQISLLMEKLEFFIGRVKKEQGFTKRGEYFSVKDETFREKDNEVGQILRKMKKIK